MTYKNLLYQLCITLKQSEITNHLQWSVCINTVCPNGRYLRRLGERLQEGLLTQASFPFLSGVKLPAIWNWLFSSTGQIYFQSGKYSYLKGTSSVFLLKRKVTQEYTLFIALPFIHVCSKTFVTVINAWGAGWVCYRKKPLHWFYLCPLYNLLSDSTWTVPFWPAVAQWMSELQRFV